MPILKKLKAALDEAAVSYEVYNHALAYTAQEIAAKQHVSGNELAKVVMLEADDQLVRDDLGAVERRTLHQRRAAAAGRNGNEHRRCDQREQGGKPQGRTGHGESVPTSGARY